MVIIAIPAIILWRTDSLNPGCGLETPWDIPPILTGSLLLLAGLALMVQTIALFISTGKGTLSPWDPPQALAVRNPMISGVRTVLLAEALIASSLALLVYFLIATGRTHAGRRANAGERTQSYPNNILRILCVLGS